jgi:hypothetical protein
MYSAGSFNPGIKRGQELSYLPHQRYHTIGLCNSKKKTRFHKHVKEHSTVSFCLKNEIKTMPCAKEN